MHLQSGNLNERCIGCICKLIKVSTVLLTSVGLGNM